MRVIFTCGITWYPNIKPTVIIWVARQACSYDTHLHIAFTHYIRSLPGLITQGANGGCGGKAAKLPAPPTA